MTNIDTQAQLRKLNDLAVVASSLIALAALFFALYWLLWTSVIWFRFHPHLPWRDLFVILRDIIELQGKTLDTSTISSWLAPHYEAHRILLPRLLMLADTKYLGGQNHLFYASGLAGILLITFTTIQAGRAYLEQTPARIFYASVVVIWLASPAHLWNMLNAINISWHLTLGFSLLGFYALTRAHEGPSLEAWLLAITSATLAAFSTFGGVIAFLLLPIYALLFDRSRIVPVLAITGVFCWWYTHGMTSDAQLATEWNVGSPEVIEMIREQARTALDNQTLTAVMYGALDFISWPGAAHDQPWPRIVSATAVIALLLGWVYVFVSAFRRGLYVDRWVVFCLFGASLALGIAMATQLGRVLNHPNHIHGPSMERYQTVVVCFWICWLGICRGLLPNDRPLADIGYAAVASALTISLNNFQGSYLAEEIESSASAADLFSVGEFRAHREVPQRSGNRFTPEVVFSFDQFFSDGNLAYHKHIPELTANGKTLDCKTLGIGPAVNLGSLKTRHVAVAAEAPLHWQVRDLILYREGAYEVRLSPIHQGNFTPGDLIDPEKNYWTSPFPIPNSADTVFQLGVRLISGQKKACLFNLRAALVK